jgi:peptide/nickel transport system substrate-binding protein
MRLTAIRTLMLAAAAAAGALAGGCERKSEGVVQVLVIGGEPRIADPQEGPLSTSEQVLVYNAAQGLVRLDARGQVEPALAETWNVSDDGLSYIFRLAQGQWPDGRKITAEQVARTMRRMIGPSSKDPLKDAFGAVDDIVAMTDRVIEIRLNQPRPQLLQLLAQPEMGLVIQGQGSGPFAVEPGNEGKLRLTREVPVPDSAEPARERLDLGNATAEEAIRAFLAGDTDLVLGGTFADLPTANAAKLPGDALRFDPAAGLFGLIPMKDSGLVADPAIRRLLDQAIDRDALIAALKVPGLAPRATVLEPQLDNMPDPATPAWAATPIADRRAGLVQQARSLLPALDEPRTIRVALPDGPGADILLRRLVQDWGLLGIDVQRADSDRSADLKMIDEVAPSSSAAWYLRHFRCEVASICDAEVDEMLESARNTPVLAQRIALLLEASRRIDESQLFIPVAAPIRWSLVSDRISGFAGNRFALHTLTGLEERLNRTGE